VDTGLADDLAIARAEEEMQAAAEVVNRSREEVNLEIPLIAPDHVHIETMRVDTLLDETPAYEAHANHASHESEYVSPKETNERNSMKNLMEEIDD